MFGGLLDGDLDGGSGAAVGVGGIESVGGGGGGRDGDGSAADSANGGGDDYVGSA